ncbi:hypothetical protein HDU83_006855 [Entophlyctis luteolus]|nr:hypothetical protein HDU83_006855 [Entophlyctis luteolus]KAJ3389127.1 hypothetical protein HDU84_009131 [Entophlyctis sp. JEL0112]
MVSDFHLPQVNQSKVLHLTQLHPQSASATEGVDRASAAQPSPGSTSIPALASESADAPLKAKRIRKEVARLDTQRMLSQDGLPALFRMTKSLKFKGKKHEFEDLQYLMFQYQKWGHGVFSKFVFSSFIEGAEKVCKERRVKMWRDELIRQEYRRSKGIYDVDASAATDFASSEALAEHDKQALLASVPLDDALAFIDEINREEEEEMLRLTSWSRENKSNRSQNNAAMDHADDDDFTRQMNTQLGVDSASNLKIAKLSESNTSERPNSSQHETNTESRQVVHLDDITEEFREADELEYLQFLDQDRMPTSPKHNGGFPNPEPTQPLNRNVGNLRAPLGTGDLGKTGAPLDEISALVQDEIRGYEDEFMWDGEC